MVKEPGWGLIGGRPRRCDPARTDRDPLLSHRLDEKIRKLEAELVKHRDIIKRTRPGPAQEAAKRRALTVLKQKRLYENQRDQLYNQQYNIEQTTFAVQSMQDSVHTVQAMAVCCALRANVQGSRWGPESLA